MRDHTKLRAFELADQLALSVFRATSEFPRHEQFGLTSQMRRAAISIPSNIVEGCARHTTNDYLRFLDLSFGSTKELAYQISVAERLDYLPQQIASALKQQCDETARVLAGLIRSLRPSSR